MAGTMRKMMEYLSLAEPQEELYDDEADGALEEPPAEEHGDRRDRPERHERHAEVTPISRAAALRQEEAAVGEDLRRIVTVHPSTYNEARVIGEAFRDGTPVIMNLTGMSEADAKRMVDFAAGLVFGLHGVIERVTNRVFLLSPATVEVASDRDEAERVGRFFNQS
ncbi:cell division protein SepF [Georgenia sp. TF02-10]|uniref:cell division protein SepF n=1 Tax=Georgenia sp. TF02-10 TaxID=2917725 RepID=UPI001FA6E563|nr:cell division protein SepF [Georgenia sp. TF02-10]UNX55984.1 cell division protein SepF [Georgenia sp. TF02-10]